MQRKRSALGRRLTVIAASAALAVLAVGASPAAAAPATDTTTNLVAQSGTASRTAAPPDRAPAFAAGDDGAADVRYVSTDEIRAMAMADGKQVMTFTAQASERTGVQDIICYPYFTFPYGPDSAGSSITVDSLVYCDAWMDALSVRPQIYRSNSLVASATYSAINTNTVAGSVSTSCVPGTYFSALTAVAARYDAYPPVIVGTWRLPDVHFNCGGLPPPPPPPAGVTVTNPGNQFNYVWDTVSAQMHASGGTGTYTWSATGLPTGLVLNSSTGLITGTVRAVGTYTTTVTATSGGQTGSSSFTWYVQSEPCPHC